MGLRCEAKKVLTGLTLKLSYKATLWDLVCVEVYMDARFSSIQSDRFYEAEIDALART